MLFSLQQYHCFLRKHLSWSSSTDARLSKNLVCCSLNSIAAFASKLCFPEATPSQSLNMTGIPAWAHSYRTQAHSDSCPGPQDSQVLWPLSFGQHCTFSCSHTTFPFPSTQISKLLQFQPFLPTSQFSVLYSYVVINFCPRRLSWHLFLRSPSIIQSPYILHFIFVFYCLLEYEFLDNKSLLI